jgi:phosphate starvation-inducible protein PhoH
MARQNRKQMQTKNLRPYEMDQQDNILHFNKHKKRSPDNNLVLKKIQPLTSNQEKVFESYNKGRHIVCAGSAGTGKSFLILYLMLNEILNYNNFNKIKIVRSCVPSRDTGFLPGNEKEKMRVYESPYIDMIGDMFGRSDAYEILKKKDLIEFISTSYVRGSTWNDTLIFVDEFQNASFHENHSLITRCGQNSRIYFSGDIEQTDLIKSVKDVSGFVPFLQILCEMKSFDLVEFSVEDVVRAGIVKEYLMTKYRLNL